MVSVEIDPNSGFCGGVIRAIGKAEEYLSEHKGEILCSLGAIVHNEAELARLSGIGLKTLGKEEFGNGSCNGKTVLIRAHGESPATYDFARENGISLIDCTCPVVLQLQKMIREAYARLDGKGRIVIFGKVGHAEVLGLEGQVNGDAVVVENMQMLENQIIDGLLNIDGKVEIFSQTTKSPQEYMEICHALSEAMSEVRGGDLQPGDLIVHDTICRQVAARHDNLTEFAKSHDVIVFVSGRESSNGRVLFDLCRNANARTYRAGDVNDIRQEWFNDGDKVGICGATSTPKWLLDAVAQKILQVN